VTCTPLEVGHQGYLPVLDDIVIEPMTERFVLWRCLHGGPLSPETIDRWPEDSRMPWSALRARNLPLLGKLIDTYGSCAILARAGEQVVGVIRFYPKAICALPEAGQLCLQQSFPAGPSERLVGQEFQPLEALEDRTLVVHCMMTGSPSQGTNPYQRRGLGTRLARALVAWARERGWQRVEANAYEDLDVLYAITGDAGLGFWQKLGFRVVQTDVEPELLRDGDFARTVRAQAAARGLGRAKVVNKYTMAIELG
jgi:hypothetical protein